MTPHYVLGVVSALGDSFTVIRDDAGEYYHLRPFQVPKGLVINERVILRYVVRRSSGLWMAERNLQAPVK